MRIILDTDKRTITVPWNYQAKLDEINRIIMEVSDDEEKKKTYGNYAAVGREIGRSGSTVAKYINLKNTPAIVAHTFKEVVRG